MNKFLKSLKLLKTIQKVKNWNRPITMKGLEIGIKNHHTNKNTGPDTFKKAIKMVKNKTNTLDIQKLEKREYLTT